MQGRGRAGADQLPDRARCAAREQRLLVLRRTDGVGRRWCRRALWGMSERGVAGTRPPGDGNGERRCGLADRRFPLPDPSYHGKREPRPRCGPSENGNTASLTSMRGQACHPWYQLAESSQRVTRRVTTPVTTVYNADTR